MNLILLLAEDFIDDARVQLRGRRLQHVMDVHRAKSGDALTVGVANGRIGSGVVTRIDADALEMTVTIDRDPPPPLDVTLVLAVPRPKVLNRVIAGATSMGVKHIVLINAWRVEKSYWSSPRMTDDNLRAQSILGLEQARDTMLPLIETRRFFRRFVEHELPTLAAGSRALVAHPHASDACPRDVRERVTLVIGPEGGFIEREIESLRAIGFDCVTLGERILRVETAVPWLLSRLM